MDFVTYQRLLGINFSDKKKARRFVAQIHNFIISSPDIEFDNSVERTFCNHIGTHIDKISALFSIRQETGLQCVWDYMVQYKDNYLEFLSAFVALMNSYPKEQIKIRNQLKNALISALDDCKLSYEIIQDDDGYFVFPKGATELDNALVSDSFLWLIQYPKTKKAWSKALRAYAEVTEDKASEIADKFRKALETFFQEFFNSNASLENIRKDYYKEYLRNRGVSNEIRSNLDYLLQAYEHYMNNRAKHHDETNVNVLEYLMYQTGNIMRLLITLKQEEMTNAD